jgi:ABC-2 type transport system permease protein
VVVTGAEQVRPVTARAFVRLKARVLRNGFRGKPARIIMFLVGAFFTAWLALAGFVAMLVSLNPSYADAVGLLVPALVGSLLVVGWFFGPLVWFGVDETLDPARFALLPIRRGTLVGGLLSAALLGVPAIGTILATSSLVVGAALWQGWFATALQVLGWIGGVLLCVALSRAVTSAFANMLRSRRVKDVAALALALVAAMIGPAQWFGAALIQRADRSDLEGVAHVLGWTPLGAPWTVGYEAAHGAIGSALLKLLITAVTVTALLRWWSATLETAMVGQVSASTGKRRPITGGPVERLFGPLRLPRTRTGALIAREVRYWLRDTRRRAALITFAVIGVFLPVVFNLGGPAAIATGTESVPQTLLVRSISMIFVGTVAALNTANQFGFDGTAFALHLAVGVPGRREIQSRAIGYSIFVVPLMLIIATIVSIIINRLGDLPMMLGCLLGAYGVGLATTMTISVVGAYSLPENQNPFAVKTGAGVAKSLLALLAFFGSLALGSPMALGAVALGDTWRVLALPIGLGYGVVAILIGTVVAGDLIDRRGPELLAAVTPRD